MIIPERSSSLPPASNHPQADVKIQELPKPKRPSSHSTVPIQPVRPEILEVEADGVIRRVSSVPTYPSRTTPEASPEPVHTRTSNRKGPPPAAYETRNYHERIANIIARHTAPPTTAPQPPEPRPRSQDSQSDEDRGRRAKGELCRQGVVRRGKSGTRASQISNHPSPPRNGNRSRSSTREPRVAYNQPPARKNDRDRSQTPELGRSNAIRRPRMPE